MKSCGRYRFLSDSYNYFTQQKQSIVEKIARMLRLEIGTPKLIQLLGELFNPTKPFFVGNGEAEVILCSILTEIISSIGGI